jgi:CXXX repeat modification system protein
MKQSAKLTKKESEVLKNMQACKHACQELIQKVVKHYEDNYTAEQAWWDAIREKYKLKSDKEYAVQDGVLQEFELKDQADKIIQQMNSRHKLKEYILKEIK